MGDIVIVIWITEQEKGNIFMLQAYNEEEVKKQKKNSEKQNYFLKYQLTYYGILPAQEWLNEE